MYCLTEVIRFCLSEKTLGIVFPAAFSFVNLGGIYLCPYGPELRTDHFDQSEESWAGSPDALPAHTF